MFTTIINSELFQPFRVILDVAILSLIFYYIHRLLRNVKIPLLFNQIGAIILIYVVASLIKLETVLWVFESVVGWIIVGTLVVFQPELRALVMRFDYSSVFRNTKKTSEYPDLNIIIKSIKYLTSIHRGAIFVFPRKVNLENIISSKVEINAKLSIELLQTIFAYDTVLHDGAVIIQGNTITYSGCFLPTERGLDILFSLGARHRAALGLSQNSDAVILVISEEYGSVSLVFDGEFLYDMHVEKACMYVEQLLKDGRIDIDFDRLDYSIVDSEDEESVRD